MTNSLLLENSRERNHWLNVKTFARNAETISRKIRGDLRDRRYLDPKTVLLDPTHSNALLIAKRENTVVRGTFSQRVEETGDKIAGENT